MSITVGFTSLSKRENSTKQLTMSATHDCTFKNGCSMLNPTLLLELSSSTFPTYTAFKIEDRYYKVTDIRSIRNNLFEIDGVIDVLATYKTDILATTAYVSYSSHKTSDWLPDNRIPLLASETVAASTAGISVLDTDGFYVLTVVGYESAAAYDLTLTKLKDVIQSISNWETTGIQAAKAQIVTTQDPATAISNIGMALVDTGFIGNAYSQAPSCIRSCIWVPFAYAVHDGTDTIFLGNFNTGVQAKKLSAKPTYNSTSISIPWQNSDWRRKICEEVYLYLPLVGMISIASDEIINETSLTIKWSVTPTDGVICYEVLAGSQVIGTYSANAAVNYPIGINQQASAGELFQTFLSGLTKTVSAGMETAKASASLNPISSGLGVAAGGINTALTGVQFGYDVLNVANTSHASCIGSIGGGAGLGLDLSAKCFTVNHPTVITPASMEQTMGLPTMAPMSLATLTGYCQCANAHVDCAATKTEQMALDRYLNSGFFIE